MKHSHERLASWHAWGGPSPAQARVACAACRILGGSASRCRRELRHCAPVYNALPAVGSRVRVRWLPEEDAADKPPESPAKGGKRGKKQPRASWYFATVTAVDGPAPPNDGTGDAAPPRAKRRVAVSYDDGGGDDEIDWPDSDAVLLPAAHGKHAMTRSAAVSDDQKTLVGRHFALPNDATKWQIADVFYSVEEGIDGVVVQYYDADRAAPTDADVDAFEWAAYDDFVTRAILDAPAAATARRGRSPRKRESADDKPPTPADESPRKRRR